MAPAQLTAGTVGGLARVALAAAGFGFLGIFARIAYDHGADVSAVIAFRALSILPLLGLLAVPARRSAMRSASAQLLPMAALMTLGAVTYFVAVFRMSPALVTLVIYAYPALAVIGSRLLGWTVLGWSTLAATGLTIGGVVLAVGVPSGEIDLLAVVLALLNAFGYTGYLLLAQPALRKIDALTCFAVTGGLSSLLLLPGAFLIGDVALPDDRLGLASLFAAGIVSTTLPSVLQLSGIRRLGSGAAALVTCLEIVTVVVASAVVLHSRIPAGAAVGCIFILAGALAAPISTRGAQPEPRAGPGADEATVRTASEGGFR